jgi:ribosomal protein S18 acetylase RimI-like enzyme
MSLHLELYYGPAQQRAELEDPRNTYLVAEIGGALAGYTLLRRGRAPGNASSLRSPVEIARFYVAREWHGRGVAQALMAAAVAEARRQEGETLWLTVWTENPRAIAFYRKEGFIAAGTSAFRLGTLIQQDYLMARDLMASPSPAPA